MAAQTNWAPAWDVAVTHAGTTLYATTASLSETVEQFETTSTESNGDYEFGAGITTRTISCSIPVDDDTPFVPALKSLVAVTWTDPEGGRSGYGRVVRATSRGGGKGGFTVDLEIGLTGSVTVS